MIVLFFVALPVGASLAIARAVQLGRIANNERAVKDALRSIAVAEADFRSNDRDSNRVYDYWTADVAGLYSIANNGIPIALIDREVAEADAAPLKPVVPKPIPYHGYFFKVMRRDVSGMVGPVVYQEDTDATSVKVHNNSRFGICAYPAEYGRSGRFTLLLNEGSTLYKEDTGGMPKENWPFDEALRNYYSPMD